MTVRINHPESVNLGELPIWRTDSDSVVYHLARDFAHQAWSNSRKVRDHFTALERLVKQIAAGEGGKHPYLAVEPIISLLIDEVTGVAAEIGVEVAARFRPDDIWRHMVTDYENWAQDWGEPDDRPYRDAAASGNPPAPEARSCGGARP